MLIVIAAVLAAVAFAVLFRLLWLRTRPGGYATAITIAAAVLVLALAVLAATGRLHWLAAIGAALLPFLRRAFGLLRYLPLFGRLLGGLGQSQTRGGASGPGKTGSGNTGPGNTGPPPRPGIMSRQEALAILGLGSNPTRDEIIAAHRRLIQRLHPDRGGSTYLAQQLNEAKRVLLQQGTP